MAGWAGNQNLYPDAAANPNAPYLGSPNLYPWQASGVAGVVDTDGLSANVFWGSVGLLAFSVWAALEIAKTKNGRR